MNALVCTLNSDEFSRVCNCSIEKRNLGDLVVTNEAEIKRKSPKSISSSTIAFKMGNAETSKDMFCRFANIINVLIFRENLPRQPCKQIHRSLSKSWEPRSQLYKR